MDNTLYSKGECKKESHKQLRNHLFIGKVSPNIEHFSG